MTPPDTTPPAAFEWRSIQRGRRLRPLEWLVERGIFAVSLSAIVMVFLIFLFVAREALPILFGRMDSSVAQEQMTVEEMKALPEAEQARLVDMSLRDFREEDPETIELLLEVKAEEMQTIPDDPDIGANTVSWRYLVFPHQWTGYDKPEYIWQPVSQIHKYNIVPLFIGSLKATLVALLFAVPFSLGAAIYVSQLAAPRTRELLKPVIEMLAGIPSVVLGFFALIVMASVLQDFFGYQSRLNALVAGLALGIAIIPVVFSIAEDALTSVPRSYTQAALALGSSKWQAAWRVVLPAAIPGVFAAVVLGFGRAIGETMIVLMASGNASILSWDPLDSVRTVTATIAAELAETVFGGHHYRMLFLLGTLLFAVTFVANLVADVVIHRLKKRLEGLA
ncbi:MAG TPA: phosphate ABC transporter permease subunit PstC [Verrucomicrobiae bacterium]|nr:phosphate ABC transporter permease subunit PstC [Verrucomicrobiae bacterium]